MQTPGQRRALRSCLRIAGQRRAADLSTAMWDAGDPGGVALSFGAKRSTGVVTYRKKVLVRNYAPAARVYTITPSFRYADDQASGAATLSAPATVSVPANGTATFIMSLRLDASKAASWPFGNTGGNLGNGPLLNGPELDGYVTMSDGSDTLSLPWHILPHKASNVMPATTSLALGGAASGVLNLTNTGAATAAAVDVYSLDATSPKLDPGFQPRPGDNYAIIDVKSVGSKFIPNGAGAGLDLVVFAVNIWGARPHPSYPAEFDIYIDADNDGTDDFVLYTAENGTFASTGQNVVVLVNLKTDTSVIRFFSASDLSSANLIMPVLMSGLGITPATKFSYQVFTFDNHFTGALTDLSDRATVTPGTPRFAPAEDFFVIPVGGAKALTVNRNVPGGRAGLQAGDRFERVPEPPPPVTGEAPAEVLERIRTDLAARTKQDTTALKPIRDEAVTWSDGALGCPRFGEVYPQLPTHGYWIVFEIEGRQYDYRVDARGRFRLCDDPRGSGKLPADDR